MKYTYPFLLLIALVGFSTFSFAQDSKHVPNLNTEKGIGTELPQFAFELPDGSTLTPDVMPEQPVIVFYFDPDCDHCNKQAKLVMEQPEFFEGVTLVWVSWAMKVEDNVKFFQKYFMDMPDKVYIARDVQFSIDQLFGYSEVPSIYVYDKTWKRTASFAAETDPEILLKHAKGE